MVKTNLWKRLTAGFMVLTMAFLLPGVHVNAAEKETTYVKEFRLYIDERKDPAAAKDWFEKNGYTMIEGNLNADASGALKKEVGVYLGYSTTTEQAEAVTDLAVMNERGNYALGEYEQILKQQERMYTRMVADMKDMIDEYRVNVRKKVATAVQARDLMNAYKEDDSGELLGDLLMKIDDEALTKLLMQANGQIVLMIQERLASACDTGNTTWMDRMSRLGSYKNLEKQALKACNNDIGKALRTLDKKYKEDAVILAENWNDIRQHFIDVREKIKAWDITNMEEAVLQNFLEENKDNPEVETTLNEFTFLNILGLYSYEEASLAEFFDRSVEEFQGDGIRKLYPLAASLSDGQISAVNQSVSLFTLLLDALNAGVINENKSGKLQRIIDKASDSEKNELDEFNTMLNDTIEEISTAEPLSVYAGVDRETFKGGVAVTSTARSFSNGDGLTWVDTLANSWVAKSAAIAAAVGSIACAVGAGLIARSITTMEKAMSASFNRLMGFEETATYLYNKNSSDLFKDYWVKQMKLPDLCDGHYHDTLEGFAENLHHVEFWDQNLLGEGNRLQFDALVKWENQTEEVRTYFRKKAADNAGQQAGQGNYYNKITFYKKLQLGLAAVSVILGVADIVMTSITLYKYYNRDHLPIPSYMVDISYDLEKQTSFINYRSVHDQNDAYGDVNGGGGKQWLALYQARDDDAGAPILAPDNGEEFKIIVQYGDAEEPKNGRYSPLHLFGTPNTSQNLTYADGESGWSYNDGKKGTYVFFRRDDGSVTDIPEDEDEDVTDPETDMAAVSGGAVSGSGATGTKDIGTSAGSGLMVLTGVGCGIVGIIIGFVATTIRRRKNRKGGSI